MAREILKSFKCDDTMLTTTLNNNPVQTVKYFSSDFRSMDMDVDTGTVNSEKIVILDAGAQYSKLIDRYIYIIYLHRWKSYTGVFYT